MFLFSHSLLILIISGAAYLRFAELDTHTIFFGDAGKDLFSAYTAYTKRHIPLVGIESSRPYLHQGPLSVWLSILVFIVAGVSTHAQAIVFAFFGMLAVIALYELAVNNLPTWTAYVATALLSVFPLAVAHSRMPYHTTLIPLAFVFFLWSFTWLLKAQTKKNVFVFCLFSALLIMTELSNIPLLALVVVPFIPRILKNKMHGFSVLNILQAPHTFEQFHIFGARIFSSSGGAVTATIAYILSAVAALHALKYLNKTPPLIIATLLSGGTLLAAYLVNGQVSEAYMPPFFIIFAIVCAYALEIIFSHKKHRLYGSLLVGIYYLYTAYGIWEHSFFVGTQAFAYESTGELQTIARTIALTMKDKPYQLKTAAGIEKTVLSYFDNLKWIQFEKQLPPPSDNGKYVYLIPLSETPPPSTYHVKTFTTQKMYVGIGSNE